MTLKLVTTVRERCRVCYTCVRECPAKAIRIRQGQAEVIHDRCIGCGNCVRVCRQSAKQAHSAIAETSILLSSSATVAAMVAPSFPAEFPDMDHREVVALIRDLGFDRVCEVAYGADRVAEEYRRSLSRSPEIRRIGSTCPAVVSYVEKYYPSLVGKLAPIASPMVATARILRNLYGRDLKTVFIGPCIAKKAEASASGEVDAVLTFLELREMLDSRAAHRSSETPPPSDFDPPHPGLGMLFPISRGLLQAAGEEEDLLSDRIVATDGRSHFIQAVKELADGTLDTRLLEVLCCNGCIMGPGLSTGASYFSRRSAIRNYAATRRAEIAAAQDEETVDVDLCVCFRSDDRRIPLPSKEDIEGVLRRMGKCRPEDELDCGACGYDTCRDHAIAILKGLAESEMCLPFSIDRLKSSLQELEISHTQLADTQQALLNAEKLASMGQLSAGIAHEINNPLGVILLYAKLLEEAIPSESPHLEDIRMIAEQAERCKGIVTGLLNFARKNKTVLERCDLPQLIDHSLKMLLIPEGVSVQVTHRMANRWVEIDPNQITQVVINLVMNAVESMPDGGRIHIVTEDSDLRVRVQVEDTGQGISQKIIKQIFEPLFTTKQIGKGCGLGLAVTYGIVKMHRGDIQVRSNAVPAEGPTGTTFTVDLPRSASSRAHSGDRSQEIL